jgi:hypothetical protein
VARPCVRTAVAYLPIVDGLRDRRVDKRITDAAAHHHILHARRSVVDPQIPEEVDIGRAAARRHRAGEREEGEARGAVAAMAGVRVEGGVGERPIVQRRL